MGLKLLHPYSLLQQGQKGTQTSFLKVVWVGQKCKASVPLLREGGDKALHSRQDAASPAVTLTLEMPDALWGLGMHCICS